MTHLLQLTNVSHRYRAARVLREVSLELHPGERVLVLGANGSGKSTFLKVLAGLLTPFAGVVRLQGERPKRRPFPGVGYLGHELLLYRDLTVEQNLSLFARLMAVDSDIKHILSQWELLEKRSRRVAELSRGERQRVTLARAFLGSPKILILDEPTTHLDQAGLTLFAQELNRLPTETLVVAATHDTKALQPHTDRALLFKDGVVEAGGKDLT